MLRAIAADLDKEQSSEQQLAKSQGHGPRNLGSAAESHAITRLMSGFTLNQVVSEFRALRASVASLWMLKVKAGAEFEANDLIRFNEAIDQALAESIASYTHAVQASRDIFLGILGHDLRTPLGAILLGSDVLLQTDDLGARATKIASRIYSSVRRANRIVGDLLDFTRSQLGPGIPVHRARTNLTQVCERIVEESRTVHPEASILFSSSPCTEGFFDEARLEQVFSNLIGNAVEHGSPRSTVTVKLESTRSAVQFSVHNSGNPIPAAITSLIFNPMGRYSPHTPADRRPHAGMGLGLFIAAQIVTAHGGSIDVSSDAEKGTTFTVTLPSVTAPTLD